MPITVRARTDRKIVELASALAWSIKQRSVREKPQRRFYVPFFNPIGEPFSSQVLVRTSGDPAAAASTIRAAVKQVAANLPPLDIETMNERIAESLTTDRTVTEL